MRNKINKVFDLGWKYRTALMFLVVLLIGVFFRLYKLDSIPLGLNNDSAWEGSAALDILRGNIKDYIPYAAEGWRGEAIIRVIVAGFTLVFGNGALNIKLASTLFGVGVLIPIYFLIKNLFNKNLALLTTFFIATSGWHIIFSRSGWRAVCVPFFASLSFYFLFKGLENKKDRYFALSGIMLGLITFYTYDAARIFPFLFIFWIFIELLSRKDFIKTYFRQLINLSLSFLLVSAPVIVYAINNWTNFTSRSEYLFVGHQISAIGNLNPLFNNIVSTLLLFNINANGNDFFIYEPLLDDPTRILFLIGGALLLLFILVKRNKYYFFILCWLAFSLIPGIISIPNGNRGIGAVPGVYFIVALGTYYLAHYLFHFFRKIFHWINIKPSFSITIIILLICAYSIFNTFQTYFGANRRDIVGYYSDTLITTDYIKTIWDKYDIYLTDNYPRELLTYYLYKESSSSPFTRNYVWLENGESFLTIPRPGSQSIVINPTNNLQSLGTNKGLAFFMFDNFINRDIANRLLQIHPNGQIIFIYNKNEMEPNVSSLVVLIPPN